MAALTPERLSEIINSKGKLHAKLSRLGDLAVKAAERGEEEGLWGARYAATILPFVEFGKTGEPLEDFDEVMAALARVFGERAEEKKDYEALSPGLKVILRVLEAAGCRPPSLQPWSGTDWSERIEGGLRLEEWREHAPLLRRLLALPEEKDPKPILILLSDVNPDENGAESVDGSQQREPADKVAAELEALVAVHLAGALASAYPARQVAVRLAEWNDPDLADGRLPKEFCGKHRFLIGGHESNPVTEMARAELESNGRRFLPWIVRERENGGRSRIGIQLSEDKNDFLRSEYLDSLDKVNRRGKDLGLQYLHLRDVFGDGGQLNICAGQFACGTAGAAYGLADPSYVLRCLEERNEAKCLGKPWYTVIETDSGTSDPWPLRFRVLRSGHPSIP